MPIRKEHRKHYGAAWREMSRWIRFRRAGGCCERCGVPHGQRSLFTGRAVVLQTHHRNGQPGDDRPGNLLAVCGRCHLALDRDHHRRTRQRRKDARRPLLALGEALR